MAGSTKNYSNLTTIKGPVDIWFDLNVPGASANVVLFTDGTPDSGNTNALHAGMLKTGGKISITAEIQERTSDNLAAPYDTRLLTSQMSIGGDMLQFSAVLMEVTVPGATRDASPPSGYTGITLGDLSNVNYTCMAAIWEQATTAKYWQAVLYNAYQANGFDLALNRNEDSAAEVLFKGVSVSSRATEDRTGALWIAN